MTPDRINRLGPSPEAMFQDDRPRFLSEADCHALLQRLARIARGGGVTTVCIQSSWTGNVRWARNLISTSGEVRNNDIRIGRDIQGAQNGLVLINDTTDDALVAATRRAERLVVLQPERSSWDLVTRETLEPVANPQLFSEATYQLDAEHRAAAAVQLAKSAVDAGMLSAGYLQVSAHSMAMLDTVGRARYYQYTWAQYSVTVRDPQGTGSGWAGVDWHDWTRIDAPKLSAIALDKCLRSRNPVAIEPGRYTTILEPQAVCGLVDNLVKGQFSQPLDRAQNEDPNHPRIFFKAKGSKDPFMLPRSMLGDQIIDARITIGEDPMDPDLGFPPFSLLSGGWGNQHVYHPATWIRNGVLTALAYDRKYALTQLSRPTGLPNPGAYRMSGGETSVDEMVTTTKRGLLVTRLDRIRMLDGRSLLVRGYTRDGLWLIEDGKISKAVKNMVFTESVLFVLNNVLQLGVPQRVFHPVGGGLMAARQPVIVPPIKVKDFSFTAIADAV